MYGRESGASQADVDRLVELTSTSSLGVDGTAADAAAAADADAMKDMAEEAQPERTDAPVASTKTRSWFRSPLVVAGTFAVTLAVGIVGGLGIAVALPPEPVQGIVPPDASMFRSESIIYYGEIDGVRVWTGDRIEEDRQCLMALRVASGAGGISCAGPPNWNVVVDIPSTDDEPVELRVSMDLSNSRARPVVDSARS